MRRTSLVRKTLKRLGNEVRGLPGAFGMRPVRPEEEPVGADVAQQLRNAVLPERRDPDVLPEEAARMLREVARVAVGRVVETVEEVRDPRGPVLDARHTQPRMPFKEPVAEGGCVEVAHGPPLGDDPRRGERNSELSPPPGSHIWTTAS